MLFREVAASLYAWDLLDEGVEPILDTLTETARCNSTYLVALMHDEKRPLTDHYYPHNPRRKLYWPEDSRVYWHPDPARYSECRIRPRRSDRSELRDTDWLRELVVASRARDMYTGAELSHTWIDRERLAGELSDVVQRDVFGRAIDDRIGTPICCNHPDVRAYARALYTDLVANYDIDMVQTCLMGFHPGPRAGGGTEIDRLLGVALGGCFCRHCRSAAERAGLDWDAIVGRLRWIAEGDGRLNGPAATEIALLRESVTSVAALLVDTPELHAWLRFRCDSVTAFYAEIHAACHAVRDTIDVRLNHWTRYPELSGIDLKALDPHLDSVRSSDYSEQSGDPDRLEWKRGYLHGLRRAFGPDKYLLSAISPRPRATPELVKRGILVSAQCGADALTIGHYDGAWPDCLRAIGAGLDEAGITIGSKTKAAT